MPQQAAHRRQGISDAVWDSGQAPDSKRLFAPEAVVRDSHPIYKAYGSVFRSRSYQAPCFMTPIS